MANMKFEEFADRLDEVLEIRKVLAEKQELIACRVVDDVAFFPCNEEMMLRFAKSKGLAVSVERDAAVDEVCCYCFFVKYEGVTLRGYTSEVGYKKFKEEGLLP